MSGFLGGTKAIDSRTAESKQLAQSFGDYLSKGGFSMLNLGAPDLQPIKDAFTLQTDQAFARAKEGSGNLTGTGYGARIGRALGDTATQQGAYIAQLLEQSRQANANRVASLFMPFLSAGTQPQQVGYQPGFLDYALSAGGQLAGAAASVGGFGKLF